MSEALVINSGQVERVGTTVANEKLIIGAGAAAGLDVASAGILALPGSSPTATSVEIGASGAGLPITLGAGGAGGSMTTVAGDLTVSGNEIVVGTSTFQGNTQIGDAISDTLEVQATLINSTAAGTPSADTTLLLEATDDHLIIVDDGAASAVGGALGLVAGLGGAGTNAGDGGAVTLTGGQGGDGTTTDGSGGGVTITGGAGGTTSNTGAGGDVTLRGGAHNAGSGSAGSIFINPGVDNVSTNSGDVNILDDTTLDVSSNLNIGNTTNYPEVQIDGFVDINFGRTGASALDVRADGTTDTDAVVLAQSTGATGDYLLRATQEGTAGSAAGQVVGAFRQSSRSDTTANYGVVLELATIDTGAETTNVLVGDADPSGDVTGGDVGSLYLDGANGAAYIKTANPSTWAELSTGSGATPSLSDVIISAGTPDNNVDVSTVIAANPVILDDGGSTSTNAVFRTVRTGAAAGNGIEISMGASATGRALDIDHTNAGAGTIVAAIAGDTTGSGSVVLAVDADGVDADAVAITRTPAGAATGGHVLSLQGNTNAESSGSGNFLFIGNSDTSDQMDLDYRGLNIQRDTSAETFAITATDAALPAAAVGTSFAITAGTGTTTAAGGSISLTGGVGGPTDGAGGAIAITGGAGGATNSNGGDVTINGGALAGTGADGAINIGTADTSAINSGNTTDEPRWTHTGLIDITSASGAEGGVNFTESLELNSTGTGAETASVFIGDSDPDGNVTSGAVGSLFIDAANATLYQKTAGPSTWSAFGAGGGNNLQQAYAAGNTISVTTANGAVALSNSTDVTDVLTVDRTFVGAGDGISVTMGEPGDEAVTGIGVSIVSGTGATGSMLFVNNQGSGDALQVQDGGTDVLVVSGAGGVDIDPTSGQSFTVDVAGAGSISLDAAAASNFTVSGATADLTLGARGTTITLNETGDTALDGDFTATSIIGALNELLGGSSSQTVVAGTSAEALATGAPAAFTTSNTVQEGDANSGDAREQAIGLVLNGVGSAAACEILVAGEMTVPDAQWDSAPGAGASGSLVYLSSTVGNLTTTAPGGTARVLKLGLISFADANANTTRVIVPVPDSVKL